MDNMEWDDCSQGFKCRYCDEEIIVDHCCGPTNCKCGAVYELEVKLIITPPNRKGKGNGVEKKE